MSKISTFSVFFTSIFHSSSWFLLQEKTTKHNDKNNIQGIFLDFFILFKIYLSLTPIFNSQK